MNRQIIRLIAFLVIGFWVWFIWFFMLDNGQYVENNHWSADSVWPCVLHEWWEFYYENCVLAYNTRKEQEEKFELLEKLKLLDQSIISNKEELKKRSYEWLDYMNPEYLQGFE